MVRAAVSYDTDRFIGLIFRPFIAEKYNELFPKEKKKEKAEEKEAKKPKESKKPKEEKPKETKKAKEPEKPKEQKDDEEDDDMPKEPSIKDPYADLPKR